jgi:hypothetical protein
MGGAGQHKDKKKAEKQGDVKHKKPFAEQGVAEGLPQTLRKVVPGHAKREIDKKMDAGKFGKTDADKDANFQRYKKIQDKLKEQGVAEAEAPLKHHTARVSYHKEGDPHRRYEAIFKTTHNGGKEETEKRAKAAFAAKKKIVYNIVHEQGVAEEWSQKYKSSINCSHPKGFSQKAHCAGKKKHNESMEMEMTCPDCGMCESHGNLSEIKKGAKDSNGFTKCWSGYHAAGTKKGKNGSVRNCIPNESVEESATAGATSAGNVAVGAVYPNKKGKTFTNKDGTAKNALDVKGANLMTGGSIKR